MPQVREAAEPFVSKLFPCSTKVLRTAPLRAMVIGAFVRGLSMRDIESLCEKAELGKLSNTTAERICTELRERFEAFKRHDLYDVQLAALFLDAIFLPVRPDGPREGVLVTCRCWHRTPRRGALRSRLRPRPGSGDARPRARRRGHACR
jgi:Transposase, Mutator family